MGNQFAIYEHRRSNHERRFRLLAVLQSLSKLEIDLGFQGQFQGYIGDFKPHMKSTHHRQLVCKI